MITVRPFQPVGNTSSATVSTGSQAIAINNVPRGTSSVRIVNTSAGVVYIGFGASDVTVAAATGMPMLPGTVETFQIRNETTHVAVRGAEATGSVFVTSGESA